MKEILKNIIYTGIGAAFLTKEKIEALKDDLVQQGKMKEEEGREFVKELQNKTAAVKDSLDLKIAEIIEEKLKQFDLVTKDEFIALQRQVQELQVALNKKP